LNHRGARGPGGDPWHIEKCGRLITAPPPENGVTTHVAVLDGLHWGSNVDELAADGEIITIPALLHVGASDVPVPMLT
jgi:hypothetical protein